MAFSILGLMGANAQRRTMPDEQRQLAIYEVMVASFQHDSTGTPGYTQMWGPDGERKNGNLRGIINALDYIRSLNVNAIWLTPIFDSSEAQGGEKLNATGYFTNNYFKIDPHFGTEADFRELVRNAHDRGLYVILDGVFGHHGGVTEPSPSGHRLDTTPAYNMRDQQPANVSYPGSLDYIRDVATYWIDEFEVDGWRLDQAYQLLQDSVNYWNPVRKAVEDVCARRKAEGKKWGTLGYMVGEDWGNAATINNGVYRDGGLITAFDFDGKERLSGPAQKLDSEGLENGWDDVIVTLRSPRERGYLTDSVAPTLFLTNHDTYRLADHFDPSDPYYYPKQMARFAVLAAYNGPIQIYYGDEYADRSVHTTGGAPDNIARTSGHLEARDSDEASLADYLRQVLKFRSENPAMWRGNATFEKQNIAGANTLTVRKKDTASGNEVLIVFSDADTTVPVRGIGGIDVDAWRPELVVVKAPAE